MRVIAAIALAAVLAGPAAAQHEPAGTATENVTVTGQKSVPDSILQDFITRHAAPAQPVGKIARWEVPVCPVVAGLPAAYGRLVLDRVLAAATEAGAPVGQEGCKANVDIVFSPRPQAVLDEVRKKHWDLLGYHDTAQSEDLAKVSHAVQAWYTTQTVDLNGYKTMDARQKTRGVWLAAPPDGSCKSCTFHLADAREARIKGSRLSNTLRSELFHVIVTVDMNRIAGLQMGALSDDIAMLALAPTRSFDACGPVASVTNLTAPDCPAERKADSATEYDRAYLKSLYRMDLSASLGEQKTAIGYHMKKNLEGQEQ